MKALILVAAFQLVMVSTICTQSIKWYSPEKGFAKAAKEKKIVLVDIYTDWCGWCKKMDKETYANKSVAKALNKNFVCVKYNPEKDGKIKIGSKIYTPGDFEKLTNVEGYPSTAFFRSDGKFIETIAGYLERKDFLKNVIPHILKK